MPSKYAHRIHLEAYLQVPRRTSETHRCTADTAAQITVSYTYVVISSSILFSILITAEIDSIVSTERRMTFRFMPSMIVLNWAHHKSSVPPFGSVRPSYHTSLRTLARRESVRPRRRKA